ncbi:hypothetical protein [uncultured Stenotrophomonas sp.]|uniref:hypothetical protein n=1 Tax=uncultured Stenotrophomonas sp. TaxID=165438 RepID=UPI0025CBFCBF|nr:hypothetical protein [uncultured Stenotrophomonas sp.]
MAIEFCPLESAWGNWADWAAVIVGVGAAIGTILVAFSANKTSQRAAAIAEDAKGIAQQQHQEAVQLREGIAGILGNLLAVEVTILPLKLGAVLRHLDKVIPNGPTHPDNRDAVEWVLAELRRTFMPSAEESLDRLHNLPGTLGGEIAQLVGMCRGLVDASIRIDSRFARVSSGNREVIIGYNGTPIDFLSLKGQLVESLRDSIRTARNFGDFIGAEHADYAQEEALIPDP